MANLMVDILWWAAYIIAALGTVVLFQEVYESHKFYNRKLSAQDYVILRHLNHVNNR